MTQNQSNHLPSITPTPSEPRASERTPRGRTLVLGIIVAVVLGLAIFGGIHTRLQAEPSSTRWRRPPQYPSWT